MIWVILAVVAFLVIGFLVVVALQPADFRIERSDSITGPPEAVFPHVNDFHQWDGWSPWAKLDPQQKTTFEGPPTGSGSIYSWSGNSQVGQGRMTITESRPSELVRIRLEFMKPFAATNTAEFTFKPEGSQTRVTWSMTGRRNFVMKGFSLFMNMDKMLGGSFEQGLANLNKSVSEGSVKK